MDFFITRDLSDSHDSFVVYDNSGNICYKLAYKAKNASQKFYLLNSDNEKNGKIKIVPLPMLRAFSITADNRNIRLVVNVKNKKVFCYFYGIGWHVVGSLFTHSFDFLDVDNSVVATQTKSYSNGFNSYQLKVNRETSQHLCICAALCLDMITTVDNPLTQAV